MVLGLHSRRNWHSSLQRQRCATILQSMQQLGCLLYQATQVTAALTFDSDKLLVSGAVSMVGTAKRVWVL